MPDDYSADIETAGAVTVGGIATGEIETSGDRDWFAVELEAGRTYRIDLRGSPTGDGTLSDPRLYGIRDADGALISDTGNDDGGYGYNSRVTFTPTETGTYYIEAGAFRTRQGTYEVEVRDITPPPDDFADTTATTGTIEVGGSATGEIGAARDRDWFAVELEEGRTYRIDLRGSPTGDGTLRDPRLYGIRDADGALISGTGNDDGGHGLQQPGHLHPDRDRHPLHRGRRLRHASGHLRAGGDGRVAPGPGAGSRERRPGVRAGVVRVRASGERRGQFASAVARAGAGDGPGRRPARLRHRGG